jgi:hypothetical protein
MAKNTLYQVLPELEEANLIVSTREIGKASLYRLNDESPIVEGIHSLIRSYVRTSGLKEELPGKERQKSMLA